MVGVVDHFQMSESSWKDFPDILKWIEKCKVTGLPAGPIINSLWWTWDGGVDSLSLTISRNNVWIGDYSR